MVFGMRTHIYCEIVIAFLGCFCVLHSECELIINNAGGDDVVGVIGKNVTFRWNFFNHVDLGFIYIYYNKIKEGNKLGTALFIYHNELFDFMWTKKISSSSNCYFSYKSGTCNIILSNLTSNDSGWYIVLGQGGGVRVEQKVLLTVYERNAVIRHCWNESLPQLFKSNTGDVVTGDVTLCGKPKPEVTWYIGNEVIKNATVDDSMKDDHKYMYSFQLTIKTWMFGQNISYYGTGIINNVSGSAVLLPREYVVSDVRFTQIGGCPSVTWLAKDHRLWQADMVLTFIKKDNSSINVYLPVSRELYNDCKYTANSTGLTYKILVYWKKNGKYIQSSVSETSDFLILKGKTTTARTNSTFTTPYTPVVTQDNDKNQVDHFKHLTLKIVGLLLAGLVFGILLTSIAFIILSRRGRTKADLDHLELESRNKSMANSKNENKCTQIMDLESDQGNAFKQPIASSNSTKRVYEDISRYYVVPKVTVYEVDELSVPQNPKAGNPCYELI